MGGLLKVKFKGGRFHIINYKTPNVKEWVLVWFDRRRPRVLRISIARFRAYHHIQEYRIETKFNELIFDTQKMIY